MTLQDLKNFISKCWQIIFIVIISFLLPAIWLKEKLVISYAESGFTFLINPLRLLNLSKYIWWDIFGLGVNNARALCSVSYHLMTSVLQFLKLSAIARQYLVFVAILLLSSLSMYFLTIELLRNKKEKPQFIALIVALFYILNPYTMNIWHRFTTSIFGLPLLPLIFLVTIKLLKKPSFKYAFLFAAVTLLFSVNAINPGYFIPPFLPAILYVIFEILRTRRFRQWKYFGLAIFLALGLNFWWLLPLLNSAQAEHIRPSSISTGTLEAISHWTPILFISRLIDSATIHWYRINYHPGWIEFLIPPLAAIAILFGIKRNRNILFFGLLLIVGLFLGKGLQPPGGFIYRWMFLYVPFFQIFRSSIEKFGLIIAFSYSFLVPLGILELRRLIKKKPVSIGITAVILILLFGVSVWPMWTGDVFSFYQGAIPEGAKNVPTAKVKIPGYWKEAANYINQDTKDYRIVFLPQSPFDGMWYKWQYGYAGADFGSVNLLFNRPVITQLIGKSYADAYRKMVIDELFLTKPEICLPLFSLMNIRYILVRNDVNEFAMKTVPLTKIQKLLSNVKSVDKIKTFDKLDIYKISDEYFLPHIYPSVASAVVNGDIEVLASLAKTKYLDGKPALFFNSPIKNKGLEKRKDISKLVLSHNRWKLLEPIPNSQFPIPNFEPEIVFQKINPTKYRVKVRNAREPFWLVFSENFHEGWRAYIEPKGSITNYQFPITKDDKNNFGEIVAEYPKLGVKEAKHLQKFTPSDIRYLFRKAEIKEHYLVNGYANAWWVPAEQLTVDSSQFTEKEQDEEFEIILYFWPQSFFYLGLIISGITFVGCIGYLVGTGVRRRRRAGGKVSTPRKRLKCEIKVQARL